MLNEQLSALLTRMFPSGEIKQGTQYIELTVPLAELHEAASSLRKSADTAFDYLVSLTAVDYPESMTMVYHLESTSLRYFLVLKTNTDGRENPVVDSVSDIWPTAEFHEREVFDLFGIRFNNHPDLRRLFLDDGWGFPLRKDYEDDVHIVAR